MRSIFGMASDELAGGALRRVPLLCERIDCVWMEMQITVMICLWD